MRGWSCTRPLLLRGNLSKWAYSGQFEWRVVLDPVFDDGDGAQTQVQGRRQADQNHQSALDDGHRIERATEAQTAQEHVAARSSSDGCLKRPKLLSDVQKVVIPFKRLIN